MAIRPVLLYPRDEEKLRTPSATVTDFGADLQALIQDLKDTLAQHPGAGLAAPQIDVRQRVAIVRLGQDEGEMQPPIALVNPSIIEEGETDRGFDGCLSMPKIVTWDTLRPTKLRVKAQNAKGEPFELALEGIDAILVHHEIDHLDGVFFLDRLAEGGEIFLPIPGEDGKEKLLALKQTPEIMGQAAPRHDT